VREKKSKVFSRIVFKLKGQKKEQNKTRVEKKLLGFFPKSSLSLSLVQLNRKKTTHCSTDKRDNYEVK